MCSCVHRNVLAFFCTFASWRKLSLTIAIILVVFSKKCTFFGFLVCYLFFSPVPYFSPFSLDLFLWVFFCVYACVSSFNAKPAHHQAEALRAFFWSHPCPSWQSKSLCHTWAASFRTTCWIALLPSVTPARRYYCSGSWHLPQQSWIHASRRHGEISGQVVWEFRSAPAWQHRGTWKGHSLAIWHLVSHYLSQVWTL